MRKAVLLIIAALLLFAAGGCTTGAHELDERAYVLTIGVDKGVSDKLRFTFQFPTLSGGQSQSSSGGGESSKEKTARDLSAITIDCPTIYSGIAMIYSSYSRRMNLTHAVYLIISEELARESVMPFINGMTRSAQVRRTMYVIVCKGKAMDFIKELTPFAGTSVAKSLELIMQNSELSGLYEIITYNEFANRSKCTKCQATATLAALNDLSKLKEDSGQTKEFVSEGDYYPGEVPRQSENKFEFMGTALFNGMTMVGELNGNETRSMLMLRGDFKESQIVIPDPADPSLRIGAQVFQQKKPVVKVSFEEGKVKIHATVYLEGALQNVQNAGPNTHDRIIKTEDTFERFIREKLDQTVKKCQALNCEVFDFGYKAARQFWTIQDWEKYDWLTHFKDAEVTTEVELVLRRTGTLIASENQEKAEG
jgi:spore germination protein KC